MSRPGKSHVQRPLDEVRYHNGKIPSVQPCYRYNRILFMNYLIMNAMNHILQISPLEKTVNLLPTTRWSSVPDIKFPRIQIIATIAEFPMNKKNHIYHASHAETSS